MRGRAHRWMVVGRAPAGRAWTATARMGVTAAAAGLVGLSAVVSAGATVRPTPWPGSAGSIPAAARVPLDGSPGRAPAPPAPPVRPHAPALVPVAGSVGQPLAVSIRPAPTTTALRSSSDPVGPSTSVTFTATVASPEKATGTVSFTADGTPVPTCQQVPVSSARPWVATCALTYPALGTHLLTAAYSGGMFDGPSQSPTLVQYVQKPDQSRGYWLVASDGGVFAFGDARFYGSTGSLHLNAPVVGMAVTPDGAGYWLVASDGGVFAFGDAGFYGSTGALHLDQPIVGITPTGDGRGYWLVAADGGIFAFGDAGFFGSAGGARLNSPVVAVAPTPDGGGYWIATGRGEVVGYGDAAFYGSMNELTLNKAVVGMAPTPDGGGYWLTAADGGVFAIGDAGFFGSMGHVPLQQAVVGMATTPDGGGYWMDAADGGIFAFGDAGFYGSMGGHPLNRPVVGMAATRPAFFRGSARAAGPSGRGPTASMGPFVVAPTLGPT